MVAEVQGLPRASPSARMHIHNLLTSFLSCQCIHCNRLGFWIWWTGMMGWNGLDWNGGMEYGKQQSIKAHAHMVPSFVIRQYH